MTGVDAMRSCFDAVTTNPAKILGWKTMESK